MSHFYRSTLIILSLVFGIGIEASLAQPATQNVAPEEQAAPTDQDNPSPLQPGDAFGEEVTLPERTIIYIKGSSSWEKAFDSLVKSFKTLREYFDQHGLKASGSAIVVYTKTDEAGFEFEAALPVAEAPATLPTSEIAVGKTPSGKALKFTHRGSYGSMEKTYEAVTDYFDDKNLEAGEVIVEEYVTDPTAENSDKLVINVFVPVK